MARIAKPGQRIFPWRIAGWGTAVVLLLAPFAARAPWTVFDYVLAAVTLAIVGAAFELTVRKNANVWYRSAVAVAIGTALLLLWINGAVGIIGKEGNLANIMFLAVVMVAVGGAVAARFEPSGMAVAMVAAAAAETLVALLVNVYSLGANEPPGLGGMTMLTMFFAVTWLLSAYLFRRAATSSLS